MRPFREPPTSADNTGSVKMFVFFCLWTDMIVHETYEPDFWKIAFSSKLEHVGSNAYEFTAVSVSVKHMDSTTFTTEPESASFSRAAGYWSCCFH